MTPLSIEVFCLLVIQIQIQVVWGRTNDQWCLFLVQVEYNRQTSWLHPPIGNLWIWTLGCGTVYHRWSEIFCWSVIYSFYIASHKPSFDICHLFEWTWSRKSSSLTGKETLKELQKATFYYNYQIFLVYFDPKHEPLLLDSLVQIKLWKSLKLIFLETSFNKDKSVGL